MHGGHDTARPGHHRGRGTRLGLAVRRPDGSLVETDLPEHVQTFFPVEKFAALVKDPAVLGYRVTSSAPYRRPSRFPAAR